MHDLYIETSKDGVNTQELYQPFDVEKEQENQINASNAELLFAPKFIPYYPALQKFDFTDTEILIFGFIDFVIGSAAQGKFYFSNENLGKILNKNPDTISRAISKLEKQGFIKTHRKIKANGGQIRYINISESAKADSTISTSPYRQKLQTNNNKINKNNIYAQNNLEATKSDQLDKCFSDFWQLYPRKVNKTKAKKLYQSLLTEHKTIITSLKWYKFSTEPQYIPHPTTWLRNRRLEDEEDSNAGALTNSGDTASNSEHNFN